MLSELSPAELRVAKEMTKGGTREQVAERLFVSHNTVKSHLKNIFLKLNIHSELELWVLMACESLGKKFSAKELREKGVSILLSVTLFVMGCMNANTDDMRRMPRRSGRKIEVVIDGGDDGRK